MLIKRLTCSSLTKIRQGKENSKKRNAVGMKAACLPHSSTNGDTIKIPVIVPM